MTDLRTAAQQALEAINEAVLALDSPYTSEAAEEKALRAAIAALRAALAQQAEPVHLTGLSIRAQSTIGRWLNEDMDRAVANGANSISMPDELVEIAAWLHAQAEPVEPAAWIQPDHLQKARVAPFLCRVEPTKRCADFVPFWTAPPQRKPLMSDKDRPDQGATYIEGYGYVDTRAVRAIERAHGIGGSNG